MNRIHYTANNILQCRKWKTTFKYVASLISITIILRLSYYIMKTDSTHQLIKVWKQNSNDHTNQSDCGPFILTKGVETYLLSAIATEHSNSLNIIVSGMDSTKGNRKFTCCVVLSNQSLITVPAKLHYIHHHINFLPSITQLFNPASFDATQHSCTIPPIERKVSVTKISLSATSCSRVAGDYLSIQHQKVVPGGLAICAKVAFGDQLKASRLVEWVEMQKILGVDKILIFDLGCGKDIQSVFKHYILQGIIEIQPYSQPGHPKRGFKLKEQVDPQFSHDKHLTVMDCHQRLGGYQYILAADFDEIIIPNNHQNLKELLTELTVQNPKAAGFYFHVQFHLENWGRFRTDTDIYFQQFLQSTRPRWECEKYIYIPSRVSSAKIHSFTSNSPYNVHYVKPGIATIHHYRKCPQVWDDCNPEIIIDERVAKYEAIHTLNTKKVLNKLNIIPFDHTLL